MLPEDDMRSITLLSN